MVVIPELGMPGRVEHLERDEVGPGEGERMGAARGNEPILVAVEDEDRMLQLIRSADDVEPIQRDALSRSPDGCSPVGRERAEGERDDGLGNVQEAGLVAQDL